MIECNVKKGKKYKVSTKGTTEEITTDFLFIAAKIYREMKKVSKSDAEKFHRAIFASTVDPNSPVFK